MLMILHGIALDLLSMILIYFNAVVMLPESFRKRDF